MALGREGECRGAKRGSPLQWEFPKSPKYKSTRGRTPQFRWLNISQLALLAVAMISSCSTGQSRPMTCFQVWPRQVPSLCHPDFTKHVSILPLSSLFPQWSVENKPVATGEAVQVIFPQYLASLCSLLVKLQWNQNYPSNGEGVISKMEMMLDKQNVTEVHYRVQ